MKGLQHYQMRVLGEEFWREFHLEPAQHRGSQRFSSTAQQAQGSSRIHSSRERIAFLHQFHSRRKKANNSYSRRSFKCHFFFFFLNKAPEFKLRFARRLHIALFILESMEVFKVALVNLTGTSLFSSPNTTTPDKTSALNCFGAHSSWKKMQPMDLQQITVSYKWMCNITC